MSTVAAAVNRVAWFVPPAGAGAALTPAEAIRAVAIAAYEEAWLWYVQNRRALEENLQAGFPVPVLTCSKADHLEVPWTQYLAHMLDPSAAHGLGTELSRRLFRLITKAEPVGPIVVRAEVPLDASECRGQNVHGNSLDVLITDAAHAIAIEHKVNAGQSNWTCGACGRTKSQLAEYRNALHGAGPQAQFLVGGREVHLVFLTPGGGQPESLDSSDGKVWRSLSHRRIAECLAGALASPLASAARFSLVALLMDLNGSRLGDWADRINRATRIVFGGGPEPRFLPIAEIAELHRTVGGDVVLQHVVCARPQTKTSKGDS